MSSMSRFRDDVSDEVRSEIDALRHELSSLRKQVARRGAGAFRQSRHAGDEFVDVLRDYAEAALPDMRRKARYVEKTARDHPMTTAATAAVGLLAVGLAVTLFMRR